MKTVLALLTGLSLALPVRAQAPLPAAELSQWREDLRFLGEELPRRHRYAFAMLRPAAWDSAVRALDARLPGLRRHAVIVELMRLVALVRDGHTSVNPFDERAGFQQLPVRFYDFADGLHIIAADSAHRDLAGARVLRIGRASAQEAMDSATRIVSHEGANWARLRAAAVLAIPEVLAALRLADTPTSATLTLLQDGRERTVVLTAQPAARVHGHDVFPAHFVSMRDAQPGPDPLWLQQPGKAFWFTILPNRTLYINYRAVAFIDAGVMNEVFFRQAFAAGDSARIERVVLDVRSNGGGNNFMNRYLMKELIRRPHLDRPDRLLVLIGRQTFSAAQNLVNEIDHYTNATFVGEPTGNAPNMFGDARPLELPNSKLRLQVSTLWWTSHAAMDERSWFTPDVFIEMTADDYRARRDPVLDGALRWTAAPSLADRLRSDADRGDTAAVRRLVQAYRADRENRFRNIEADVNAAGYAFLRAGAGAAATAVFQVNVAMYPGSANVHDSLGEAYERAGRRDEAIAAYRRALQLNPNQFSSRDALRRLGASP